ncbi:MAG: chemotaxis protein CheW [Planctomycetia bacterium]
MFDATATSAHATLEACGFLVGSHRFAIPSSSVAEVQHASGVTAVPLAPDAVAGLIHLRGRIAPVIDMRRRLAIGGDGKAARDLLVMELDDDLYALLVDEVLDVELIPTDRLEPPSGTFADAEGDPRTGVFAAAGWLVHLLDPHRIVQPLLRPRTSPVHRPGASHVGTVH